MLDFIDQYLHGAPRHPQNGDALSVYLNSSWTLASPRTRSTHMGRSAHPGRRRKPPTGVSTPLQRRQSLGRFARYLLVRRQARECLRFQSMMRRRLMESEDAGTGDTSSSVEERRDSRRRGRRGSTSGRRGKRDLMTGWFIFPGTKW